MVTKLKKSSVSKDNVACSNADLFSLYYESQHVRNSDMFIIRGIFRTLSNTYCGKFYSEPCITLAYLKPWHIQNPRHNPLQHTTHPTQATHTSMLSTVARHPRKHATHATHASTPPTPRHAMLPRHAMPCYHTMPCHATIRHATHATHAMLPRHAIPCKHTPPCYPHYSRKHATHANASPMQARHPSHSRQHEQHVISQTHFLQLQRVAHRTLLTIGTF